MMARNFVNKILLLKAKLTEKKLFEFFCQKFSENLSLRPAGARVTRCFCEKIAQRQRKIAQKVAQQCFWLVPMFDKKYSPTYERTK